MTNKKELIFDYDAIIYKCGFAGENRQVIVRHPSSGTQRIFKNKTEFYGGKKNSIEGWLGDLNKERLEKGLREFKKEEFEFEIIRTAEPVENVLYSAKHMIKNICEELGIKSYRGYIGKGDSFRLERSTLWKYKGNRDDVLRPLLKDDITEYLVKNHNAQFVSDFEADDKCIMEGVKNPNSVVISIDKDSLGCPVKTYNFDKPELGIIDGNCFGDLQIVEGKGKDVKGYGRKFFYYQVAYGDDVDNYRANCVSEEKWGPISAFNALNECKTDRECLESLKNIYQKLYPEPKEVVGWRGDKIAVDWLYVFNEIWDLARMYRHEDDHVKGSDVLRKFELLE